MQLILINNHNPNRLMKKTLIFIAAIGLLLGACERAPENEIMNDDQGFVKNITTPIPGQYVVVLKPDMSLVKSGAISFDESQLAMATRVQKLLTASGISGRTPLQVYSVALEGFAINLTDSEVAELRNNPSVAEVCQDMELILAQPNTSASAQAAQVTPPGITRVGGGATYTGTGKIWIIDTGIDLDHPDLNVNTTLAKTFVSRTKSADDDNGHGSHCAGIAAAKNNSVGVVGVAAGAPVVPVKVLDRSGSGAYSTIIAGVNYVAGYATPGDAVNMSLGGTAYSALDNAIITMAGKGLYVSLAAGNSAADANNYSPARVNGSTIWTVSACNSSDAWASFSNYGNPPIDYCAPGVSIYSTYKNGGYATMSGTSMAAPHMCGVLLATGGKPTTSGYVTGDPDGKADPIVHE